MKAVKNSFFIKPVTDTLNPIATDVEMHKFLESMNFKIAYETRPNGSNNIVLYFDKFPIKYLNYVKRFGSNIKSGNNTKRSGHYPARSICLGLMFENRYSESARITSRYITKENRENWIQILNFNNYYHISEKTYNLSSPSTCNFIKLLHRKVYSCDVKESLSKENFKKICKSKEKDMFYIPEKGKYDYDGFHMKVYHKKSSASINDNKPYSVPLSNVIKFTSKQSYESNLNTGSNFINKAFYIRLSVVDAERGYVVFPDVDRKMAMQNKANCIYHYINWYSIEKVIGFIDHLESVCYVDSSNNHITLPKIFTQNMIQGHDKISHHNKLYFKMSKHYLINK